MSDKNPITKTEPTEKTRINTSTKIKFTSEYIINTSTKYRHIKNNELLIFINFSSKPFEQNTLGIFKRISDETEVEYLMCEVKLMD